MTTSLNLGHKFKLPQSQSQISHPVDNLEYLEFLAIMWKQLTFLRNDDSARDSIQYLRS